MQRAGGARPSGRFSMAGLKMGNSKGAGVTSIQAVGATTGRSQVDESNGPCAMTTTVQSSWSGIVPPCSQACSGVQISAVAMNSHSASDKTPATKKIRSRVRRLN